MLRIFTLAIPALVLIDPLPAASHEFWIDPPQFQLPVGDTAVADLRVGQEFKGGSQPYLPHLTRMFEVYLGDAPQGIDPTIGDRPALNQVIAEEGLAIVVHVTGDSALTYDAFEKFAAFVAHKDAGWTVDAHKTRGLPDTGFREVYSRYAKSLIAIGSGEGADRQIGLETEIVALENPYTGQMDDGIDVALFYQAKPRSDAQIEVFDRAPDASVTISLVRTDEAGRATVPVRPGHTYMLDAVVLREPAPELAAARDAVWESLWANLTFSVPE